MTQIAYHVAAARLIAAALSLAAAVPAAAADQPPPAFAMCKTCHTVESGGRSTIGPNLHGVVGSAAAGKAGYAYSPAMKKSQLRWTRDTLDAYLTDPRGTVPGTKMVMAGIKDAARRKAIIDYLESLK